MILWLGFGAAGLLLLLLVARLPVTFSSHLQFKAEPSGVWAAAGALGFGPIALSAVAAAGVKPFLTCHVFGKQLVRAPLSRWVGQARSPAATAPTAADTEAAATTPKSRLGPRAAAAIRALDPVETVLFWWDRDRVFEVRGLLVDVRYSFRDVALTGRILAALCVLAGVLPEPYEIHQIPSWQTEDRVALAVDGRFKVWPGRLLLDSLRFVLKVWSQARRSAALAKRATHPT